MRAHEQARLFRTFGDTDPIGVRLQVRGDTGTVPVPDTATVTLHIATTTPIEVTGVPRGDSLGYFTFATSGFAESVDNKAWEVQVVDGAVTYTIARGLVMEASEIA